MPPQDSETARWFDVEVRPHESALRAWLRARFPSLTDTDDIVQEAYRRLLHAQERGRVENARRYLYSTAHNVAVDLCRHNHVARAVPFTDDNASSVYADGATVPERACLNQELEILAEAMRALPDRCRQVLMLRRIHGLSHKEIAARLGISEHTIEKQVGIGLRRCVEFLERRGVIIGGRGHESR